MPMQPCPPNDEDFHPFTPYIAQVGILRGFTMNIHKYVNMIDLTPHIKAYWTQVHIHTRDKKVYC